MPGHIVVVGSINMDLVVQAPRHPQPGETILGTAFHTFPGGKGANQAVAAARLGGDVFMVGRVGADAFGDSLLKTLQADGVNTQYVLPTQNVPTGVALITVSDTGQNNIVVVPGANAYLTAADLLAAETLFKGAGAVVCQLEIPLEVVRVAARLARLHHARFILNPAPARSLDEELLSLVDYLIPNEHELALLTGVENITRAINKIEALGVKELIVTLGDKGVEVSDQDNLYHIHPHPVTVVDTTAAGDAFVGAFALALTEGRSLLEAAYWGNAAGALAVTQAGAQPSLPTRAALDTFMAEHQAQIED